MPVDIKIEYDDRKVRRVLRRLTAAGGAVLFQFIPMGSAKMNPQRKGVLLHPGEGGE